MGAASKVQKAYIAGFLDGEGSVSIQKTKIYKHRNENNPYFSTVISIGQSNKTVLEWIQSMYGGSICVEKESGRRKLPFYRWRIANRDIEKFLTDVKPYVQLKNKHIELVLLMRAHIAKWYSFVKGRHGKDSMPKEIIEYRNNLWLQLRGLNSKGRKVNWEK